MDVQIWPGRVKYVTTAGFTTVRDKYLTRYIGTVFLWVYIYIYPRAELGKITIADGRATTVLRKGT